jgi:hypothetical protein
VSIAAERECHKGLSLRQRGPPLNQGMASSYQYGTQYDLSAMERAMLMGLACRGALIESPAALKVETMKMHVMMAASPGMK